MRQSGRLRGLEEPQARRRGTTPRVPLSMIGALQRLRKRCAIPAYR
jgi:hypothetical protein